MSHAADNAGRRLSSGIDSLAMRRRDSGANRALRERRCLIAYRKTKDGGQSEA